MGLTAKQRRFVAEYLIDLNATQAAIRAGYSVKTAEQQGYQLLQKTSVSEAIVEAQGLRSQRLELTQDWIVERLRENVDRAMQVVEVIDREGRGTGEFKYEGGVANRALELLGKHLGMFVERREVTGKDGGPIEHSISARDMTDDELARIAFGGSAGASTS